MPASSSTIDADELGGRLLGLLAKNMTRLMDLFHQWDTNHDGQISKREFKAGLAALCYEVSAEEVSALFRLMDPDGSGAIEFEELSRQMRRARQKAKDKAAVVPTRPQSAVARRLARTAPRSSKRFAQEQREMDALQEKTERQLQRARQREAELQRQSRTLEKADCADEGVQASLGVGRNVIGPTQMRASAQRMFAMATEKAQRMAEEQEQREQEEREAWARRPSSARISEGAVQELVKRLHDSELGARSERRQSANARAWRRIDAEKLCTLSALSPELKTQMLRSTPGRWGGTRPNLEPTRLRLLGADSLELPPDVWRRLCAAERQQAACPVWSLEQPGASFRGPPRSPIYRNALLRAEDAEQLASRRPSSARLVA